MTLKDEAKSSREAAEKLSSDREPEGPMRDGQSIE